MNRVKQVYNNFITKINNRKEIVEEEGKKPVVYVYASEIKGTELTEQEAALAITTWHTISHTRAINKAKVYKAAGEKLRRLKPELIQAKYKTKIVYGKEEGDNERESISASSSIDIEKPSTSGSQRNLQSRQIGHDHPFFAEARQKYTSLTQGCTRFLFEKPIPRECIPAEEASSEELGSCQRKYIDFVRITEEEYYETVGGYYIEKSNDNIGGANDIQVGNESNGGSEEADELEDQEGEYNTIRESIREYGEKFRQHLDQIVIPADCLVEEGLPEDEKDRRRENFRLFLEEQQHIFRSENAPPAPTEGSFVRNGSFRASTPYGGRSRRTSFIAVDEPGIPSINIENDEVFEVFEYSSNNAAEKEEGNPFADPHVGGETDSANQSTEESRRSTSIMVLGGQQQVQITRQIPPPPVFDSTLTTRALKDYWEELELYWEDFNYDGQQKFRTFAAGMRKSPTAKDFLKFYTPPSGSSGVVWEDVKKDLLKNMPRESSKDQMSVFEILAQPQREGESPLAYVYRIRSQCGENWSDVKEAAAVKELIRNLDSDAKRFVTLRSSEITKFDELVKELRNYEQPRGMRSLDQTKVKQEAVVQTLTADPLGLTTAITEITAQIQMIAQNQQRFQEQMEHSRNRHEAGSSRGTRGGFRGGSRGGHRGGFQGGYRGGYQGNSRGRTDRNNTSDFNNTPLCYNCNGRGHKAFNCPSRFQQPYHSPQPGHPNMNGPSPARANH